MIEIRLLGRFSVRRAGEEVPPAAFGGRLVRALMRLLVIQRGKFVSLDVLSEALWPGRMPADPAANLRVLVNRARAALGDPSFIVTGPGGYSFAAGESCRVDSEIFLAAVEAGRRHLALGEAGAALREFRTALDHWGGEPLAEDAYQDWAAEPRAVLERARLQALEDGGAAALALRDPGQAVAMAELAVAQEPLREPAALLLAEALAAAGDTSGALRTLDALRRRLAEEVGVELSTEALDLEKRLQRGEAVPVRHAVVRPARPALQRLPFVGRQAELEILLAAGPRPVLVSGEAGAGKSRLFDEAAARCRLTVLSARAFLAERDEPWSLARPLLVEALTLEGAQAIPERAAQALADVLPELEDLRAIRRTPADPESRRVLAVEGAVQLMAAATTKGALLLVDDLQWADATSVGFLAVIVRRLAHAGLAFAYRPDEVQPGSPTATLLAELARLEPPPVSVPLGPLPAETVASLVSDPELARVVAEETDRTPLAVAEVIRALVAQGAVEAGGRFQSRTADAARLAREAARSGARRAIAARAERQPAERRQTLCLLALLGREVPARVLCRAGDLGQTRVLDELEALARAGLVRLGDNGWATAHDLISEVVTEGLEAAERGRCHQLLASALQAEGGDRSELARHLAGAGDRAAGALALCDAAGESLERFAGDEAKELADAGLALDPEPSVRRALLRVRGEARAQRGDLAGARDDLRAALAARGPERSRVLARIAELTSVLEDYERAATLIEAAIMEAGGDTAARAEALAQAAILDVSLNRMERATNRAEEAFALFERLGDAGGMATILDVRANAAFLAGRITEATLLYERTAGLYRDAGRLLKVGTVQAMRGLALTVEGRPIEGLAEIDEALELERMLGQTEGEAVCLWQRGEALTALGRIGAARAAAEAALELSRATGNRSHVAWTLKVLGGTREGAGDLPGAEAAFRESLAVAPDFPLIASCVKGRVASLLALRNELASAEQYAREALSVGVGFGDYEARLVLAELAHIRGEHDGEQLVAEALAMAEAGGYRYGPTRERLRARSSGQ